MLLLEGETDTMAAWQALPERLREHISIVGISGLGSWRKSGAAPLFADAERVFAVIDNDDPYTATDAAAAGEKAWQEIREDLGRKARRVRLPQGINDLAEFFMQYDWAAFETLLTAAVEPKRNYPRIDFTRPVPPVEWLIEGLIERGVVTALVGDSGVGKSWITMAMGKAVAAGDSKFVGRRISHGGAVLIVDEENAEGLVRQRMAALGLTAEHYDRLEYISQAGVDLWTQPGLLLEDALEIEPALIVIDSQSAVSIGAKENENDDMTRLYKEGFKPLARLTGAAVIVLHHTPKENRNMARGAGAIKAQADQMLSVVEAEGSQGTTGRLNLFASKARRRVEGLTLEIRGDMEEDGVVEVVAAYEEDAF
jgi:hypothetical protein